MPDLDHFPAVGLRRALDAVAVPRVQALLVRNACAVEVLPVVVDDPGDVAQQAFRGVGHGLEQRALAELRIADQGPEVRLARHVHPVVLHVAVGQRQVDRDHRGDPDGARGEEVEGVRVGAGVVALENRLGARLGELAQARHGPLGLVVRQPGVVLAPEEAQQVVIGVVDRRRVGLAAHVVVRAANRQVQGTEDVERARAGRRVTAHLGVARALVLALVRLPDHVDHLGVGAVGDAAQEGRIQGGHGCVGAHGTSRSEGCGGRRGRPLAALRGGIPSRGRGSRITRDRSLRDGRAQG